MNSTISKCRLLSCFLSVVFSPLVFCASSFGDWKSDADARIEQYRKGDLQVVVQDIYGNPIEGAAVHIEMKDHAFGFGTALNACYLRNNVAIHSDGSYYPNNPDSQKYVEKTLALFNTITIENEMKWRWTEALPQYAEYTSTWLKANGKTIRGHTLICSSDSQVSEDVVKHINDPGYVRDACDYRVTSMVNNFADRVTYWDVLNEPHVSWHNYLERVIGYSERVDWFQLARAADPDAKLYINDYNIMCGGNDVGSAALVNSLRAQGAPIDGVGIQGHDWDGLSPSSPELSPANLWARFQTLAAAGVDLQVTEYGEDLSWNDTESADFLEMFMTLSFSHPDMQSFVMWGFWDGMNWRNDGPLFDEDWNLKPAGQVYMDLVFDQWWTDMVSDSNKFGKLNTRAFLGEYEISASFNGCETYQVCSLRSEGGTIVLTIPVPEPTSLAYLLSELAICSVSLLTRKAVLH